MRITLYTTSGCSYCDDVTAYLEKFELEYLEVGVPPERMQRTVLDQFAGLVEDFRGVPVIVVEKENQKYIFESAADPHEY